MTEWDVAVTDWRDAGAVEAAVEAVCAVEGLALTMESGLASYPGCTHWHWKRGKERGVLEVTLWPQGHRLWLSVQSGRTGAWTEAAAERVREALEAGLGPRPRA